MDATHKLEALRSVLRDCIELLDALGRRLAPSVCEACQEHPALGNGVLLCADCTEGIEVSWEPEESWGTRCGPGCGWCGACS